MAGTNSKARRPQAGWRPGIVRDIARLRSTGVAALVLIASLLAAAAQDQPPRDQAAPAESEVAAPSAAAPKPAERVVLPHLEFKSLDGETTLFGHLFRPKDSGDAPRPAVVMLHGCSGLLARSGRFFGLYRAWTRELLGRGYVVLVVDSASPRGFGETCSAGEARRTMWRERPKDAYAALQYLQQQPFVRAERIALLGWSQGGGVALLSVSDKSIGRPAGLAQDFAAAAAFYPGACEERLQTKPFTPVEPGHWTTRIPLLVLIGQADSWTLPGPCEAFVGAAKARGNPVELKTYPAAGHGFDAPNTPRTELPQYRERDGRIPAIGTDKDARADALTLVPAFLARTLAN